MAEMNDLQQEIQRNIRRSKAPQAHPLDASICPPASWHFFSYCEPYVLCYCVWTKLGASSLNIKKYKLGLRHERAPMAARSMDLGS